MHPLLVQIIDTPEFQRLKNIKQLGGGYFVFPGASHNRFEHSIGVAHLAGELVEQLNVGEEVITDKDKLCVQIAGLCHDLGHGPFSHVFESFMKEAELEWKHEEQSVKMFEQLITRTITRNDESYTIEQIMIERYQFEDRDIVFIEELICSENPPTEPHNALPPPDQEGWSYKGRGKEKSYLFEIVRKSSRDCLHLGMKSNFSHERYVMFARVCTNESNEKQICIRDKEALNMYELFHIRYLLHHNAYQHRVTKAIEMMIVDALLAAERTFTLDGKKISDIASSDPELYLRLTDDILQQIKTSPTSPISKDIIKKIEQRDLYTCIGTKIFPPQELDDLNTVEQQENKVRAWLQCIVRGNLHETDFKVRCAKIDYGMKNENPINSLRFYRKGKENEAIKLPANEVSYIRPEIFYEIKVMLFYKPTPAPELSLEVINMFWKIIRKFPKD
ncbi:hypothetical protein AMELA_G00241630 [Ameiurus melas]|uniref:HD domain-containing protein n=1 Tax=Ameiurus melas TaxID=219545 RepID=A0A7J5ZXI8_AMEME|nr:hypothetical protein AMELA_G00241630 [Ameiurus melas]